MRRPEVDDLVYMAGDLFGVVIWTKDDHPWFGIRDVYNGRERNRRINEITRHVISFGGPVEAP